MICTEKNVSKLDKIRRCREFLKAREHRWCEECKWARFVQGLKRRAQQKYLNWTNKRTKRMDPSQRFWSTTATAPLDRPDPDLLIARMYKCAQLLHLWQTIEIRIKNVQEYKKYKHYVCWKHRSDDLAVRLMPAQQRWRVQWHTSVQYTHADRWDRNQSPSHTEPPDSKTHHKHPWFQR